MTGGQVANGVGSAIVAVSGLSFIVFWTIFGRWYRTSTGRFMVMKAAAISVSGILTLWLTLGGFAISWDFLRYIQAGLWVMISLAFLHHTVQIYTLYRKEKEKV